MPKHVALNIYNNVTQNLAVSNGFYLFILSSPQRDISPMDKFLHQTARYLRLFWISI
jgi:hypothetical protein